MSFWNLFQICFDLLVVAAGTVIFIRLNRPAKDDPRMSKGLQILQTKISILEDLSDRTETQVSQLTALLENKCKALQQIIAESERQILKIEKAKEKSLEVAKIFQDKIPHSEILERQSMIKYVKAAKMAHQGKNVDEISKEVDLSQGELEFIAKVNRDQLMFSESQLPDWIHNEIETAPASQSILSPISMEVPTPSIPSTPSPLPNSSPASVSSGNSTAAAAPRTGGPLNQESAGSKKPHIRPVEFPRIEVDRRTHRNY